MVRSAAGRFRRGPAHDVGEDHDAGEHAGDQEHEDDRDHNADPPPPVHVPMLPRYAGMDSATLVVVNRRAGVSAAGCGSSDRPRSRITGRRMLPSA